MKDFLSDQRRVLPLYTFYFLKLQGESSLAKSLEELVEEKMLYGSALLPQRSRLMRRLVHSQQRPGRSTRPVGDVARE